MVVVTSHTIGLSVEYEPSTSDCVIDEEILSSFEVESPRVSSIFNGVDHAFTWSCTFSETDGDIAIVLSSREESKERWVLV